MNLRHLRIFRAVCEEQSITKAAQRLYMTQPAVSHAIRELENDLHAPLFDRISRKIYLTQTGRIFFPKVIRVLEMYEELEKGSFLLENNTPLSLGSSITIANFWLPDLLKRYRSFCPDTPVRVEINQASQITKQLLENEIDLGLIEGAIRSELLVAIPFSSYRLVAVCSNEYFHTLPDQVLSLKQLCRETLLLREPGSAIRDAFDSALMLQDLATEPAWCSVNSQALIHAVKNGFGISILPDILVQSELNTGALCEIPIVGLEICNENHLVIHKNKHLSKPLQFFIDMIKQQNPSLKPLTN